MNTATNTNQATPTLSVLDRALYALFSRYADAARHDADCKHYPATGMTVSFDVSHVRAYGLS